MKYFFSTGPLYLDIIGTKQHVLDCEITLIRKVLLGSTFLLFLESTWHCEIDYGSCVYHEKYKA